MVKKMFLFAIIVGVTAAVNAEVLFYTDFSTTPAGFAEASDRATAKGADDTLVINDSGATEPKEVVIDGCTLSAAKSSTGRPLITISKGSQSYVKLGDTVGCTPGRLSLKNSNNSITFPSVTGPCTFTYYAAASSASAGRALQCVVNDVSTPEAGISEMLLEDSLQATRKVVYPCLTEGPVVIKLISQGGGIYLYDVKIESGATVVVNPRTRGNRMPLSKKDGLKVSNRAGIEMFTLAGQKVIFPGAQSIPHALCSKGTYVIRIPGSKKEVTSINVSR